LLGCGDPASGSGAEIWVSARSARQIAVRHEARFAALVERFRKRDIKHVHLTSPGVASTQAAINAYFRHRRREAA
jgi:hypothetical protein